MAQNKHQKNIKFSIMYRFWRKFSQKIVKNELFTNRRFCCIIINAVGGTNSTALRTIVFVSCGVSILWHQRALGKLTVVLFLWFFMRGKKTFLRKKIFFPLTPIFQKPWRKGFIFCVCTFIGRAHKPQLESFRPPFSKGGSVKGE